MRPANGGFTARRFKATADVASQARADHVGQQNQQGELVRDGLGGWHVVQASQDGVIKAQVPYYVKRSFVSMPKVVKAGAETWRERRLESG